MQVDKCSLQALLPLFHGPSAHAAVRISLNVTPVEVAVCVAQMNAIGGLLSRQPGELCSEGVPQAENELLRELDRQADIIAHLLERNDELAAERNELREANAVLSCALERHVAVVATLAAENAAMLEQRP